MGALKVPLDFAKEKDGRKRDSKKQKRKNWMRKTAGFL